MRRPATQELLWAPRVDLRDTGDALLVHAELPGVPKENIKVDVKNGILHLSGERKHSEEHREGTYLYQERSFGKFSRSLRLPSTAKEDSIEARFKEGVLEVRVPKEPLVVPQPRAITID